MKPETESLLRYTLGGDPSISKADARVAIDILYGYPARTSDLVHVIRFDKAVKLLGVARSTLGNIIRAGLLDRVFGTGRRAFGITQDSYQRFVARQPVRPAERKKP